MAQKGNLISVSLDLNHSFHIYSKEEFDLGLEGMLDICLTLASQGCDIIMHIPNSSFKKVCSCWRKHRKKTFSLTLLAKVINLSLFSDSYSNLGESPRNRATILLRKDNISHGVYQNKYHTILTNLLKMVVATLKGA